MNDQLLNVLIVGVRSHTGEVLSAPPMDKENARLIVSQIILDMLNGLEMTYPDLSTERQKEVKSIRERLIGGDLN